MKIAFTKMQGTGNDYIYVDAFRFPVAQPESLAKRLSDRHFSVGADGLVLLLSSGRADLRMRMFNADGSEAQMCGNAARCVARYAVDHGLVANDDFMLETMAGIKRLHVNRSNGEVSSVCVDMGEPLMETFGADAGSLLAQSGAVRLFVRDFTLVNMGNPHAVCFVDDVKAFPVHLLGPQVENHPLFPMRTNVEFVEVVNSEHLRMRVWERGTGETLACGTGACASVVAAVLNGKAQRRISLQVQGGELQVWWEQQTNHVFLQGPAEYSFEGTVQI